jgi:hypothetical protein
MNTKSVLAVALTGGLLAAGWAVVHRAGPSESRPATHPAVPLLSPTIRVDAETGAAVDVVGLSAAQLDALTAAARSPEDWAKVFSLRVVPAKGQADPEQPAVLGSYSVDDGVLRFRPRYPLARGVRYLAVFEPAALSALAAAPCGLPPAVRETIVFPRHHRGEATAVEHVYPSADRLPENLLKFYLHFTAPMSRGGVYQYIHLLGPGGKEVDLPFLELDEELWDTAGIRLTLFIDPGRIKRGLKPREDVGPVLEKGKAYTLVLDRAWPDADGQPLREDYRKIFTAGPPDNVCPDPQKWQVRAPGAGTREALMAAFPEPLDHALLVRLLTVTDAGGQPVLGQVQVRSGETAWQFTPEQPWQAGAYRLVIDTRLEDLVGNRIGRPFEVDLFDRVQREITSETVELPFHVMPRRKG